jgi:hypothetical protein
MPALSGSTLGPPERAAASLGANLAYGEASPEDCRVGYEAFRASTPLLDLPPWADLLPLVEDAVARLRRLDPEETRGTGSTSHWPEATPPTPGSAAGPPTSEES